jgi:methylated-DNA-[protein]-cysteine S-methyltransferase
VPPTVHVAAVDAPWGPIHLAAWDRGLVACESMTPFGPFVERLERRFRTPVVETRHRVLDAAVAQVEAFLADRRRTFELPIDLGDRPAWDQAVLGAVGDVPWGRVATYGQIARAIDRTGAARAVGGAVARSPIGIVVPCHRIVAADGSLGRYGGVGDFGFGSREQGLRLKRELLLREGVDLPLPAL